MPDRETVLTWLEICGKNDDCSSCCPYGDKGQTLDCRSKLMADALAMLREDDAEVEWCTRCGRIRLKSRWEGR